MDDRKRIMLTIEVEVDEDFHTQEANELLAVICDNVGEDSARIVAIDGEPFVPNINASLKSLQKQFR